MKQSLLVTALGLIAVLIISCQVVPVETAEHPSLAGIRGRVIITGMQDLSMCSIIAKRQINGKTVSVIKEIGSSKAATQPPVGYHDQMQIFDNKQTQPTDPASGGIMLEKRSDEYIFSTVSDLNGKFELMDLPEGLYTVTAYNEHTLRSVPTDVLVTAQAVTEINIVLTAIGSISGTVQLDSSTEALLGTFVYAEGTSYIAWTDYLGNFTIKDIPTGEYDIIFYHDGYTSAETVGVIVNASSETTLDMVNLAYIGNFPVINTVDADPPVIEPGTPVTLSASAFDQDGDDLTYTWSSSFGTFVSDTGNPVTWTVYEEDVSCKITVTVSDGVNETIGYVNVFVVPAGTLTGNIWRGDFTVEDMEDLEIISLFTRVTGDLSIDDTALITLNPLENLTRVDGSLSIDNNSSLTSISGLNGLTSIGGELFIKDNGSLINIDGLQGITSINGSLKLISNTALENIEGLRGITFVGGDLSIERNPLLKSEDEEGDPLKGLNSLVEIGGTLNISMNVSITNVDHLAALDSVGGDFLYVRDNIKLPESLAFALRDQLTYFDGTWIIFGNKPD